MTLGGNRNWTREDEIPDVGARSFGRSDSWIEKQKEPPSRPEAIRRLVELGLKAKR
jgi:hypothetical protein